jgi:hypothetical protein
MERFSFGETRLKAAIVTGIAVLPATCIYAAQLPALYTAQQASDGDMMFAQNCALVLSDFPPPANSSIG